MASAGLAHAGDWAFGERETGQYVASVEEGSFQNPFSNHNKLKSLALFNLDSTQTLLLYVTLFEYGEYIVGESPSQTCAAEVYIDQHRTLYQICHAPNKQDLQFGKAASNRIAVALHQGKNVDISIVVGTNTYRFTLQADGFSEQFGRWLKA